MLDYSNIIVCTGGSFWTSIKSFANPTYPMHHHDVGYSCRLALFWDRELLRAVACSQLVAQFKEEEVEDMRNKANVFMEQLKMVKTVTPTKKKMEPEVIEPMPAMVPAPADEGKPVCSFDYEDAAKEREAAVDKWEKGARAAVSPRGNIVEEMAQTQAAVWPRG